MTQSQPLVVQTPGVTFEAADFRSIFDTLFTEGVRDVAGGQLAVTALTDGTLRVAVAAGTAYVKGDDVPATQGLYILRTPAGENVTVQAPPSAGSRLDLLVYEEIDPDVVALAGRPAGSRFRAIPGAAVTTGTPVLPNLPNTAIPLASFPVAAGQTTIPAASITDRRTQAGSSGYGPLAPPMTTTQRNAISNPGIGLEIFNTTTGKLETYGGATLGWVSGAAVNVQTFTASGTWTKPSGASLVFVLAWGGGGGGGGNTSSPGASGGSGGEGRRAILPAAALGATEQVIVGAGGATATSVGNPGGRSSFGAHIAALPGAGGVRSNALTPGGGSYLVSSSTVDNPESGGTSPGPGGSSGGGGAQYGGGAGGLWNSTAPLATAGGVSGAAGIDTPNTQVGRGAFGGGGTPGTSTTNGGDGISRSGTGRGGDGGGGGAVGGAGGIPGGGGGGGISGGGPGGRGEVIVITLST